MISQVFERITRPQGPDFYDSFSDLRNSLYSDLGLSQQTLDAGNTVINNAGFQAAVAGAIIPSQQGVSASAAIPNLVSQIKAKPLPYILVGLLLGFGTFFLIRRK